MSAVRPHLPAVHGHHRPRDQLRRRAGPAGSGLNGQVFAGCHRPLYNDIGEVSKKKSAEYIGVNL